MLKEYKILLNNTELIIYQDKDGKFIKPDFIKQHNSFGTALKPANEPIVVARKPLSEKTVADNVLKWGTGGINIDGCRIGTEDKLQRPERQGVGQVGGWANYKQKEGIYGTPLGQGRFPANIIFDEEAGRLLDEQSGIKKGNGKQTVSFHKPSKNNCMSGDNLGHTTIANIGDSGGASRFFYCAKASKKERGEGNNHPTVKPLSLIKYLVTLVTPLQGISCDPFEGSGTHAKACKELGFDYIGFEKEKDYCDISEDRIKSIK